MMQTSLSWNDPLGLLRATVTGEFTLLEAQRTFLEVLAAAAQHGTPKILLDGRAVAGTPATIERYYYGEFVARSVLQYKKTGALGSCQLAYILKEPVKDTRRFGETVAVNRGAWVRVFEDLAEGMAWLGISAERDGAGPSE